jgi:predicted ribonuclease YlaK|tara:strand:- start:206 stop:964 length:759 start_codon:yes stop_codon:yes gene_type:complete
MPAHQQQHRMTKRQKRVLKQQGVIGTDNQLSTGFQISKDIAPMTKNQSIAFDAWEEGANLMLHGIAGTGKTFLGLYFSLKAVMAKNTSYRKVYIVRSVVPTRDMGFLPGSQKDKMKVYEAPYYDIASKLFQRGDAYEILKQKNNVEFISTSFLRGSTFDDCIILVDEVQNMSDQELHTVMTRVGENCKIIFCGDVKQDDLTSERKKEMSGLRTFMKIIERMDEFDFIEFEVSDIVRSELVKAYIIERDNQGL